jgi:hypothetical protein
MLGEHPASTAVTDATDRIGKRAGEPAGAFPISLKQVKSYSLRRLLPDARHTPQAVNQANQEG